MITENKRSYIVVDTDQLKADDLIYCSCITEKLAEEIAEDLNLEWDSKYKTRFKVINTELVENDEITQTKIATL